MKLTIENVRCFRGRHQYEIEPLTLLIGENSTGKSTFLAALSTVCDPLGFPWQPRFNEPPYRLGTFDTIASYSGGRAGLAESFALGFVQEARLGKRPTEVLGRYVERKGQVDVSEVAMATPLAAARCQLGNEATARTVQLSLSYEGKTQTFGFSVERSTLEAAGAHAISLLLRDLVDSERFKPDGWDRTVTLDVVARLQRLANEVWPPQANSIAPIRSRPARIYGRDRVEITPEGEHIPYVLLRHLVSEPDTPAGEALQTALRRFGDESGLFKRLNIKRLGDKTSDPFQIMVTVSGRPASLLDVGYGVSQALPVVVESVLSARDSLLLLQQPEVHLHPRAQAALGSFFVDLVVEAGRQFVVETHSDYVVDRVRQEVASGRIHSDLVQLLFFEKSGVETMVHRLGIDPVGNIVDAPPSYREFFLREELNLLARTGT